MITATNHVHPQAGAFHDLYWAMGDSGNQLDDSLQAQNPFTHHGSILRVSVNSNMGVDHEIPDGNPFKGASGESGAQPARSCVCLFLFRGRQVGRAYEMLLLVCVRLCDQRQPRRESHSVQQARCRRGFVA